MFLGRERNSCKSEDIPTQIDLHELTLQKSGVEIEDKSESSSQNNEEFHDCNNFEDITEHFKVQEEMNKAT